MTDKKQAITYNDISIVPQKSDIQSRSNVDTSSHLTPNHKIKVPLIAAPMSSVVNVRCAQMLIKNGCAFSLPRFDNRQTHQIEKIKKELWATENPIVASIGVKDSVKDMQALVSAGANIFLIDVAHGHHQNVIDQIKSIKDNFDDIEIIAGNIVTYTAAVELIRAGADTLRVGIGNGAACSTRIETGVGVPQVTALKDVHKACVHYNSNVKIIADGGIKSPGDAAKALAVGADTVMMGGEFAGTSESPGEIIMKNNERVKEYWGSASSRENGKTDRIEGVASTVPYKGPIKDVIKRYHQGLQSAYSYVGARTTDEFHEFAKTTRVTYNGYFEGTPHVQS